jgi:hypothetical protein
VSTNWVDKSCKSVEWYTPEPILERVRLVLDGIPLDPATSTTNPTHAQKYYTKFDDGLAQSWNVPWFVNPPYGHTFPVWCQKIGESAMGMRGLALLPCGARFSTRYFQKHILLCPGLSSVCWIRGRVKFLREDGIPAPQNPYDSAIYGFRIVPEIFRAAFDTLGAVWEIS